jgi:hypothetical protein
MSTRRLLLIAGSVVVLSLAVVAIAQLAARSQGNNADRERRPTGQTNEAAERARAALAERLHASADQIEVVSVEEHTWNDASLGLAEPGMMYAQVVTIGQIVTLRQSGQTYVYHVAGQQAKLRP